MRRLCLGAAVAVVLGLGATGASAQPPPTAEACDAWARSDAAWPEIETILRRNYAYLGRAAAPDSLFAAARARAADVGDVAALGTLTETFGYVWRDGHFHVDPVTLPERAWIPSSSDFWVVRDGDRWLVSDVRPGSAAFRSGVRPGWELAEMDGQPVITLARAALAALEPQPDPAQLEYAVNVISTGRLDTPRRFRFVSAGRPVAIDLPAAQQSIAPRPAEPLGAVMHGRVARIRFNNALGDNATIAAFDAAIGALGEAEALIIDLRDTPGGGNTTVARAILGHFVDRPAVYQVHRNAFEEAVFGVPRQYAEYVFPRADRWDRPVVVLAGRWTGSVGEALAMAFDRTAGVPTIGAPLADLLGTLNTNRTDNGCMTLSFAWDSLFAADGTPREEWEPRHLLPSADTAADGSDPALAAALAILGGTGGTSVTRLSTP